MSGEWRTVTLGEVVESFDHLRVPVKEADRRPGPYPYYGASGVIDHVDQFIFEGEHLLVAEDGENLRTRKTPIAFLASGRFWVNNHAHILKGNQRANTRYLCYAISRADVGAYLTGSTMPKLTQGNLQRIPLLLPPRDEQEAIAGMLGALDDKIDLNRRMNQTFAAMAQALFRSWFVDFDPVRVKAEGRQPEGMDAETAALFPSRFVDSELGEIPEGWRVGSIYEVASVAYGAPFASKLFNTEGVGLPLIRIRDLSNHAPTVYTPEVLERQTLVEPGDVVVGMDGEFRVHHWRGPRALLNQRVCKFNPAPGVPRGFVSLSLLKPMQFFENTKTGTTVIHLGKSDIDTVKIVRPSVGVLEAFGRLAEPLLNRILANESESRTLARLRDLLLPKFLAGEIRVRDAESQIATCA